MEASLNVLAALQELTTCLTIILFWFDSLIPFFMCSVPGAKCRMLPYPSICPPPLSSTLIMSLSRDWYVYGKCTCLFSRDVLPYSPSSTLPPPTLNVDLSILLAVLKSPIWVAFCLALIYTNYGFFTLSL